MEKKLYGKHVILDLYGINNVDPDKLEFLLQEAVIAAGATIIHSFFHKFPEGGNGLTGIIALKESHLSIHTWPEDDFAAIDICMCGSCDPNITAGAIIKSVNPVNFELMEIYRGVQIQK